MTYPRCWELWNESCGLRPREGLSAHHEVDELRDRWGTPQRLDHPQSSQPSDGTTGQDTRDRSLADAGLTRQDALIPPSHVDLTAELSRRNQNQAAAPIKPVVSACPSLRQQSPCPGRLSRAGLAAALSSAPNQDSDGRGAQREMSGSRQVRE